MRTPSVILFLLLSSTSVCQCTAEDLLVTISEKTTKITGPLKPDGYPDYVEALNVRLRGKSTPQNNLAVGIWRTVGPVGISPELRPMFFNALGIDELPQEGNYLIDLAAYQAQQLGAFDSSEATVDEYSAKSKQHEHDYIFVMENAWTKESHPEVFQWWKKNQHHIKAILELTETHGQYFNPYISTPATRDEDNEQFAPELISILLPGALQARELARTLSISAHYHLGNRDIDAAMRTSIAIHRIGRLTARGETLIEGLVGIAVSGIGSTIDRHILATDGLNTKQLQTHFTELKSLPPMPSFIDKINLSERYMFLDTTIHIAKYGTSTLGLPDGSPNTPHPISKELGKALSSSLVDWDHVLRRGNYWYDKMYRIGTIENIQQRTNAYADFEKQLKAIAKQTSDPVSLAKKVLLSGKSLPELTSEQMSNVMVSLLMPSLVTVIDAENRSLMVKEIDQVGIALELHYLKNQSYPSNLNDLIGPSLKNVPEDRFNEKGLTYKKTTTGYLLYSFGINRQDNQGRSRDGNPPADDLVLKRQR